MWLKPTPGVTRKPTEGLVAKLWKVREGVLKGLKVMF